MMYFLYLPPRLHHTVFKDNRGDQSFKIHNSKQMRGKNIPESRSASPRGEKQQRCYKSAKHFSPSQLAGL